MSEPNGGSLSPGQRLERIERTLDIYQREVRDALQNLATRISRHKEANQEHVRQLADNLVKSYESRISALEKHDVAEDAVSRYRRWLIAAVISFLVLLVAIFGLLINVAGKVN